MRLTSEFWVAAYVRRCHVEGAYAVVSRRGAAEAGAIFVVLDHLDGRRTLFSSAPQSLIAAEQSGERMFVAVDGVDDAEAVQARLERERRFDPDLWIVDVEDRRGRHFLSLA